MMTSNLVASLLLVAMPFATSSWEMLGTSHKSCIWDKHGSVDQRPQRHPCSTEGCAPNVPLLSPSATSSPPMTKELISLFFEQRTLLGAPGSLGLAVLECSICEATRWHFTPKLPSSASQEHRVYQVIKPHVHSIASRLEAFASNLVAWRQCTQCTQYRSSRVFFPNGEVLGSPVLHAT